MLNDVADRVADVTPAWLSEALAAGGHDLVVTHVETERIGTGQMGTTYRLALSYEGAAGPPTLIAKLAGDDEAMRAMVATGYAAEVGFYQHLAPGLEVRTPGCWYAAITDDRTTFSLLLDDVDPAQPGVQADGCTVSQARAAIRNLVGLHAPRWGDVELHDLAFLQPSRDVAEMMQDLLITATEGFIDRYDRQLAERDPQTMRDVAQVIADWQLAASEHFSVLHGDYRLDNLLFPPSGDEVVAVDWQTAAVGPPVRDVSYFLGTSLEPAARRANEEDLVAEYHSAVTGTPNIDYSADRCWDDYRLGQLQGPLITILGCMYASGPRSERSDAMFVAMARRSCEAIRDLRSLELL